MHQSSGFITKNRLAILLLAVALLIAVCLSVQLLFAKNHTEENNQAGYPKINSREFSYQELRLHNAKQDCYMASGGIVYDISGNFNQEHSTVLISQICGNADAGEYLPKDLKNHLNSYKIGILAP